MWITAEDARSDFVLAAAAALFAPLLQDFAAGLPLYPSGVGGTILNMAWLFAATGLVPILLAKYRGHGLTAFGLDQPSAALGTGAVLAIPIVAAAVLASVIQGADVIDAIVVPLDLLSNGRLLVDVVALVIAVVGVFLLYTFLTVRAREAFKPTHLSQVEALRTYALGAAGVGLVLGLLLWIGPRYQGPGLIFRVLGVAALVLLTDRYVQANETTTRATILAPAIAVLVFWVFRSGGLFSGSLLDGLYFGVVAAAVAMVVATLIETRRYAWASLPVVAAAALYGTPLLI